MNVARGELRLEGHGVPGVIKPSGDSALASVEPTAENAVHLKSFRERGVWEHCYSSNTAEHRRISGFFHSGKKHDRNPRLIKG